MNRRKYLPLQRLILWLSVCSVASFVWLTSLQSVVESTHDRVTISLVVPATYEDFLCFIDYFAHVLKGMKSFPDECIFVVSGWQGSMDAALRFKSLRDLQGYVPVQVHPMIKIQNQAKNRNIGAAVAKGEYIFFFDMDDIMHQRTFATLRSIIRRHEMPDAAVFSHGKYSMLHLPPVIPSKPFCVSSVQSCAEHRSYRSSEIFEMMFEHWMTDNGWALVKLCCLNRMHLNLAPGWLLVKRTSFMSRGIYDDRLATGEDGSQIAWMLSQHLVVHYFNTQLGYYNSDHTKPSCNIH